jgi:hypothetical protein
MAVAEIGEQLALGSSSRGPGGDEIRGREVQRNQIREELEEPGRLGELIGLYLPVEIALTADHFREADPR